MEQWLMLHAYLMYSLKSFKYLAYRFASFDGIVFRRRERVGALRCFYCSPRAGSAPHGNWNWNRKWEADGGTQCRRRRKRFAIVIRFASRWRLQKRTVSSPSSRSNRIIVSNLHMCAFIYLNYMFWHVSISNFYSYCFESKVSFINSCYVKQYSRWVFTKYRLCWSIVYSINLFIIINSITRWQSFAVILNIKNCHAKNGVALI